MLKTALKNFISLHKMYKTRDLTVFPKFLIVRYKLRISLALNKNELKKLPIWNVLPGDVKFEKPMGYFL